MRPPRDWRVFIGGALALAQRTAMLNGGEVKLGTRVLQLIEDCERLVVVVSPLHQLARHNPLTLADLADETFIDFPAGTPGRLQSDRAFDTAGLLRRVTFEAMSVEFMLALVERNLGLCLLPAGTVPHDPRVRVIPVTDGPVRTEFLAWNGFNPSPPARAFVEQAKKSINVPG